MTNSVPDTFGSQTLPNVETERVMAVAFAFVHYIDETDSSPDWGRKLLIITSQLRLLVLNADQDLTEDVLDNLGGAVYRDLAKIDDVVINPRMRQFLGICWEGDDSSKVSKGFLRSAKTGSNEIWIFESSMRRQQFQEILRLVPKKVDKNNKRESRQVALDRRMFYFLQDQCKSKKTRRFFEHSDAIVNITFTKKHKDHGMSTEIEVIVMTRVDLTIMPIANFVKIYVGSHLAYRGGETKDPMAIVEDSDEDDGELPEPEDMKAGPVDVPGLERTDMKNQWTLSPSLKGVWFLASTEPQVTAKFDDGQSVKFVFMSDGDRQRWRQHLALVLSSREASGTQNNTSPDLWTVRGTGQTDLQEVQKEMKNSRY